MAKMGQKRELTGFIGCFEGDDIMTKSPSKRVGKGAVEVSLAIEEADACSKFSRFDNKFYGTGIQPANTLDRSTHR